MPCPEGTCQMSKHQPPSSKLQRNIKIQIPMAGMMGGPVLELGAWFFSGAWVLVFGCSESVRSPSRRCSMNVSFRHHLSQQLDELCAARTYTPERVSMTPQGTPLRL